MFLYIIENALGDVYIGITKNFDKRLHEHQKGKCISSSKRNTKWKELAVFKMLSYIDASKCERWLHKCSKSCVYDLLNNGSIPEDIRYKYIHLSTTVYERKCEMQLLNNERLGKRV